MALKKTLLIAVFAAIAHCEPPVQQPYHYNPPSTNYGTPITHTPTQSYLPPSQHYNPPSQHYNPPSQHYNPPSQHYNPPSQHYNPPSQHYSAPSQHYNAPSQSYGAPSHGSQDGNDHHHGHDNEVPKSYEFGYSVKDAQSGNDYDRKEVSDGNTVRGEYRVQLPDGRTQIVTYHADWQTGFHADVRYEGEAHYPEQTHGAASNAYLPPQQGYNQPQSGHNYNSASAFSGSSNYHGSSRPSTAYGPPGYQH